MSEDSKPTKPTGKIEFIENHRPALPSGDYEITVTQSIVATKPPPAAPAGQDSAAGKQPTVLVHEEFASQTRQFSVLGPRFTVEPQVIRAVFPPAGSLGEHSNVLPHINFNRSTLPWERVSNPLTPAERQALETRAENRSETEKELADSPKLKTPWLALLLFDQDELVEKQLSAGNPTVTEAEFTPGKVSEPKACTLHGDGDTWTLAPGAQASTPDGLLSPLFTHESGQQEGDPVAVIDVAGDLLQAILPSLEDVRLLGHVRQPTDDLGTLVGDQVATLLANRLPRAGHMSVVHLVSLEGLYEEEGQEKSDIWSLVERWRAASPTQAPAFVRLVSLQSWRFTCLAEEHSFKGLLNGLGRSPSTLRLPADKLDAARPYAEQGYVALPHEMRQGNRSVSWYRGPLAPGRVEASEGSLCARSADQLVRYNPANAMFDVSYAAAWELGRLLTLQNEKVAVSLLDWKRRHRHAQERQQAMKALEHLPIVGQPVATDLPVDVRRWFEGLALLRGVPFNYLAPSERMLPQESLRFFWIDPEWIRCLHDGAFSVGRVLPSDHERDAAHDQHALAKPHAIVTGFLLRSEVVSGWPDLQVDGYDEAVPHENYEHETLSPPSPVKASIASDRALQEAMNHGDASLLALRFGLATGSSVAVSPIVADSRWLVNVNENETLYLIAGTKDGLQLSIENKLPMLRMERLSPSVLLCLFAGDVKTVDIHQKPEALHFGLNHSGEGDSIRYSRELKSHRGGELPKCEVDIPWGQDAGSEKGSQKEERETSKRVIAVSGLSSMIQKKLRDFPPDELEKIAIDAVGEQGVTDFEVKFNEAAQSGTSAQFALQMAEGVQKVRFVVRE
ncbi:MAG: hypothetical protein IPM84_04090 [Anaerolineae bacterium]|nr:hypothetical protein [Anaerolineae bacterium]